MFFSIGVRPVPASLGLLWRGWAIAEEIGAGRTGLRLSPVNPGNDAGQDSDAQGLFNFLLEKLVPLKLAPIHIIEGATGGARDVAPFDYALLRSHFKRSNEQCA